MRLLQTTFLLAVLLIFDAPASAQPVEWPTSSGGNGHFYEVVSVPAGISWTSASAAASTAGGYLATATSLQENTFIFGLVDNPLYWNQEPGGSNLGPWFGGVQTSDVGGPAANWTWVTGEPFSYTNWAGGEPNNFTGADEDFLSFKCGNGCRSDAWNDLPDNISVFGTAVVAYVIEFDTLAPAPALGPTGAILLVAILSTLGFQVARRRRR